MGQFIIIKIHSIVLAFWFDHLVEFRFESIVVVAVAVDDKCANVWHVFDVVDSLFLATC